MKQINNENMEFGRFVIFPLSSDTSIGMFDTLLVDTLDGIGHNSTFEMPLHITSLR